MNLLEQQKMLESLDDDTLLTEAEKPSGQYPPFIVISEIQRRKDLRENYQAMAAKRNLAQHPGTVVDELVSKFGKMNGPGIPQMDMPGALPIGQPNTSMGLPNNNQPALPQTGVGLGQAGGAIPSDFGGGQITAKRGYKSGGQVKGYADGGSANLPSAMVGGHRNPELEGYKYPVQKVYPFVGTPKNPFLDFMVGNAPIYGSVLLNSIFRDKPELAPEDIATARKYGAWRVGDTGAGVFINDKTSDGELGDDDTSDVIDVSDAPVTAGMPSDPYMTGVLGGGISSLDQLYNWASEKMGDNPEYDMLRDKMDAYIAGLPDKRDATNMALMTAGLGMLAGESPFASVNIGKGGAAGLQAYQDMINQRNEGIRGSLSPLAAIAEAQMKARQAPLEVASDMAQANAALRAGRYAPPVLVIAQELLMSGEAKTMTEALEKAGRYTNFGQVYSTDSRTALGTQALINEDIRTLILPQTLREMYPNLAEGEEWSMARNLLTSEYNNLMSTDPQAAKYSEDKLRTLISRAKNPDGSKRFSTSKEVEAQIKRMKAQALQMKSMMQNPNPLLDTLNGISDFYGEGEE